MRSVQGFPQRIYVSRAFMDKGSNLLAPLQAAEAVWRLVPHPDNDQPDLDADDDEYENSLRRTSRALLLSSLRNIRRQTSLHSRNRSDNSRSAATTKLLLDLIPLRSTTTTSRLQLCSSLVETTTVRMCNRRVIGMRSHR